MIKSYLPLVSLVVLFSILTNQLCSKTKALVIGISHYQDPAILDLKWPHRDAGQFAAHLKNTKSFKIDELDLQLITNAQASSNQILIALERLFEATHKGDTVFLFYSGYGKINSKTKAIPQYPYFYDTPYTLSEISSFDLHGRFVQMAELLDLHYCAVTNILPIYYPPEFSVSEGKLSTRPNSADGTSNTLYFNTMPNSFSNSDFENLANVKSSLTDFLIKSLLGLADEDKSASVEWDELKNYFKKELTKTQSCPGLLSFSCSSKKFVSPVRVNQVYLEPNNEYHDYGFTDEHSLLINPEFVVQPDSVQLLLKDFLLSVKLGHLIQPENENALSRSKRLLGIQSLRGVHSEIKRVLIAAFLDESQQAINLYLSSDNQELVRRLNGSKSYEKYSEYLKEVLYLLPNTHYLHKQINAKLYYFEGLNLRLQAETHKSPELLLKALEKLNIALGYEPNSSYIFNEIGIVFQAQNKAELSLENFQKAAELSPNWNLPYINLAQMFLGSEPVKALRIAKHARMLNPNSSFTQNLLGVCFIEIGEFAQAETTLLKAIELNDNNFQAYYNFACLKALQEKNNEALQYLETAFQKGFVDIEYAKKDKDLHKIHSLDKWRSLVREYFGEIEKQDKN